MGVIHADSTVVSNCFATRPKWWRQLLLKINHHTWRAVWDPPEMQPPPKPSHVNNIMLESCTWLFGWCLFRMMLRIQQVGPATVNLVLDACMGGLWRFQGVFVQGVQPLEPFEHRIVHLLFLEDSWFLRLFSKFMLIGEALMVSLCVA